MGQADVYVVDRMEADRAVIESPDGEMLTLPADWLPDDASEGDVLSITASPGDATSTLEINLDPDATARRRERLQSRRDQLGSSKSGDISL